MPFDRMKFLLAPSQLDRGDTPLPIIVKGAPPTISECFLDPLLCTIGTPEEQADCKDPKKQAGNLVECNTILDASQAPVRTGSVPPQNYDGMPGALQRLTVSSVGSKSLEIRFRSALKRLSSTVASNRSIRSIRSREVQNR